MPWTEKKRFLGIKLAKEISILMNMPLVCENAKKYMKKRSLGNKAMQKNKHINEYAPGQKE